MKSPLVHGTIGYKSVGRILAWNLLCFLLAWGVPGSAAALLVNTYTGGSAPYTSNISVSVSTIAGVGFEGDHVVDGTGFSGSPPDFTDSDFDGVPGNGAPHTGTTWITANGSPQNEWISFDLGSVVDVSFMRVWNYNRTDVGPTDPDPGFTTTTRALQGVRVWYSTLASPSLPAGAATNPAGGPDWTELGSGFTFTQGDGTATFDDVNDVSFGGILARHILIDVVSNYGASPDNRAALNEVQFFDTTSLAFIPEPTTGMLLLCGVLGWAVRRRRPMTILPNYRN